MKTERRKDNKTKIQKDRKIEKMWLTCLQPQVGQEGRLGVSNNWPVQGLAWRERYKRDDDNWWSLKQSLRKYSWCQKYQNQHNHSDDHDANDVKTIFASFPLVSLTTVLWRRACGLAPFPPRSLYWTALYFCVLWIDDQYGGPSIKEKDHLVGWLTT